MNRQLRSPYHFALANAAWRLTMATVRRSRYFITAICVGLSFIAHAGDPLNAGIKGAAKQPIAAELQPLQGTWEGVMVDHEKDGMITITIARNSLYFYRDTNFWFETTIKLPPGKDPKQLHATIKRCPPSQADSMGQVVRAFYKVEDGVLTVALMGDDAEETWKSFEAAGARYKLRKVLHPKKNTEPPKNK